MEKNARKQQFTHKDISRLDKFLISTELLDKVQRSDILIPVISSDHKRVNVLLNFVSHKRGREDGK